MRGNRIVLGVVAMALTAIWAPGLEAQEDTFEWTGRVSAGGALHVSGIVGEIRATLAGGDQVQVVARKRGEEDDFHQVAIEMEEDGGDIYICAVYGEWKHGEGVCNPDHDHGDRYEDRRHRHVDMDVSVDYEVRVPAGVDFAANIVSGDIDARGLRSDVRGSSVDGDVTIQTTGQGWANTVSGDIEVDMGEVGDGNMDFNTVSGDITLWLPEDFSAEVDFSSLTGDLRSDFDLDMERRRERRWIGSSLEGTIGRGGRELKVNTVSGDVELKRRR